MTPCRDDLGVPERVERHSPVRLSPELALVDPMLAGEIRPRLPERDTLSSLESRIRDSRRSASARRLMEAARPPVPLTAPRSVLVDHARTRPRRRASAVVVACVTTGLLVALQTVSVRVDVRGNPARADPIAETATSSVVAPAPSSRTLAPTSPRASREPDPARSPNEPPARARKVQRFAWAPVPGASGYHVELFRDSSKVFEVDTKRPAASIPARWMFEQRRQSLEPGEYRWYVWPLVSGVRASRAIVQATLAISRS
jgi:hypothetical protein